MPLLTRTSRNEPWFAASRTTVTTSGCLREDQPTVSVVIGQRSERFGAQGHVGVQFTRRIERERHRGSTCGSVHAAHAVDGNFFDELKFFCDYFDI